MITKLFEFNIVELRKNKEIDEFLIKVKSENPENYSKFVSLVGNKGIEIAKQKYKIYDPKYKKFMRQKEKKENNKKIKEQKNKEILSRLTPIISDIENILVKSPLKQLLIDIKKDQKLNNFFFNDLRCEKKYKNKFKDWLKKPVRLEQKTNPNYGQVVLSLLIDILEIKSDIYWGFEESKPKCVIKIEQYYKEKELKYSVRFELPYYESFYPSDSYLKIDKGREIEYINKRNNEVIKLNSFNINKEVLYKKIFEDFVYLISEKHYKEWKFEQDVSNYNL